MRAAEPLHYAPEVQIPIVNLHEKGEAHELSEKIRAEHGGEHRCMCVRIQCTRVLSSGCRQPEPYICARGWLTASPPWLQVWTIPLCLWAAGLRKVRLCKLHGSPDWGGGRLHRSHLNSGTHVCVAVSNAGPASGALACPCAYNSSVLECRRAGIPIEVFDSEVACS